MDVFFSPPYYAFYHSPDAASVKASHKWLLKLLSQRDPYDAVICFSQGCALISSFLLYHAQESPNSPLPFRGAIFICGGIPLAVVSDLGLPVSGEAWEINNRTARELRERAGAAGAKLGAIMSGSRDEKEGLWDLMDNRSTEFPTDRTNVFGLDYTKFPDDMKIMIPTVHIYGKKDPRHPSSMQLAHFCDEGKRKVYDHGGGHDVPRRTEVSEKIAGLVRWLEGMIKE